jgi:NhaP-type Na+/H+ or K+/H+ antiporter
MSFVGVLVGFFRLLEKRLWLLLLLLLLLLAVRCTAVVTSTKRSLPRVFGLKSPLDFSTDGRKDVPEGITVSFDL